MREGEGAGEEGRGGERRGEGRGFGDRNPFLFVVSRAFARVFPVFLAYSGHIEAAGYHFSAAGESTGRKEARGGEERRGEREERRERDDPTVTINAAVVCGFSVRFRRVYWPTG